MAHVAKRTTAKGEKRYDVRHKGPDGRWRTKTFARRADADRYLATAVADVLRGGWVDPKAGQVTLATYAKGWLVGRPNLRPRTRELYESDLRLHVLPTLGAIELGRLTPSTVREWHASLCAGGSLGSSAVARCYRLLRCILGTAVADELLTRNPCQVRGAGVERTAERPVATVEQVFALADAVEPYRRALVLLAGLVGLRLGELLALTRRDVNLLHLTLTVERQEVQLAHGALVVGRPKTEAGVRSLALPSVLAAVLDEHLSRWAAPGPDGRLFTGVKGGPLRRHVWQAEWDRARRAVGMPAGFRFHDLRHTANTLATATGASTRELMRRMGHRSPEAALRYQHATSERDTAIARALQDLVEAALARSASGPEPSVRPLGRPAG